MAVPENPSAGKFGPPPENAQRERVRLGGSSKTISALGPVALFVGIAVMRPLSHSRRGWAAGFASVLVIVGYIAQYVFFRKKKDDERDDGPDPYTPPTNITR